MNNETGRRVVDILMNNKYDARLVVQELAAAYPETFLVVVDATTQKDDQLPRSSSVFKQIAQSLLDQSVPAPVRGCRANNLLSNYSDGFVGDFAAANILHQVNLRLNNELNIPRPFLGDGIVDLDMMPRLHAELIVRILKEVKEVKELI